MHESHVRCVTGLLIVMLVWTFNMAELWLLIVDQAHRGNGNKAHSQDKSFWSTIFEFKMAANNNL